ncbi:Uncharacterised protein [Mycobacteroides abscessus subsp. abscessus]|nr:Uncharacterised protein [Mycobacteroides abscessus subsp. abscessus]SKY48469.1 Uncharacterised protein [Mycobacteroides abscessus subsp. abscessus]
MWSLSTATADSRDSTLAISATVSTPRRTPAQSPSAGPISVGKLIASKKSPAKLIRSAGELVSTAKAVAVTMATKAPGTMRIFGGSLGHSSRIAITITPMMTSGRW